MPRQFIRALGLIKWAAAAVNHDPGLLSAGMADAVKSAALEVADGQHDEHFPIDVFQTGSGTSSNMNANEVIANLASRKARHIVHANDHVNMGQSSNDVIPSAIHVSAALGLTESLLPALPFRERGNDLDQEPGLHPDSKTIEVFVTVPSRAVTPTEYGVHAQLAKV